MNKKIRICQIGTMHDHGLMTIESLRKLSDDYELVGYVPESEERDREVKRFPVFGELRSMTLEQAFDEGIDAAAIECYEKELIPTAQLCVDRGVHVHIDKPAGEDINAFEKLLKAARQRNTVVQMGYMYRYNPAVRKAMELVNSGRLGRIYSVEAQMNCYHPLEKRRWLENFKGGMMFFLGCHLIDLIIQIQGMPQEINAMNTCIGEEGVTADDFGMAVLKYENGVSFAKSTALEVNGFYRRQLVICGTNGTVEINPIEKFTSDPKDTKLCSQMKICYKEDAPDWNEHGTVIDIPAFDRYDTMMRDFAKYIKGEKENPYTFEYELQLHRAVLAACGYDIEWKETAPGFARD